ncbi:hypothetical protein BLNAU_16630 [Blattamonas nauphoetae]|uniref:SPRY domain-containing protein n=1 Tax=Blattamonas nauphoetae TaxID=2049346 RepID=A0ABQ9XB60_9EUKA|nr:hypothetical protein BLNAU_16630 [Blattamonas nauphoetae]
MQSISGSHRMQSTIASLTQDSAKVRLEAIQILSYLRVQELQQLRELCEAGFFINILDALAQGHNTEFYKITETLLYRMQTIEPLRSNTSPYLAVLYPLYHLIDHPHEFVRLAILDAFISLFPLETEQNKHTSSRSSLSIMSSQAYPSRPALRNALFRCGLSTKIRSYLLNDEESRLNERMKAVLLVEAIAPIAEQPIMDLLRTIMVDRVPSITSSPLQKEMARVLVEVWHLNNFAVFFDSSIVDLEEEEEEEMDSDEEDMIGYATLSPRTNSWVDFRNRTISNKIVDGITYTTVLLEPHINEGIFRLTLKFLNTADKLAIGVIDSSRRIPADYFLGTSSQSACYHSTGSCYQNARMIKGNKNWGVGDKVSIEIDMDAHRLIFLLNMNPQPIFFHKLPSVVRIGFTFWRWGSDCQIISFHRLQTSSHSILPKGHIAEPWCV